MTRRASRPSSWRSVDAHESAPDGECTVAAPRSSFSQRRSVEHRSDGGDRFARGFAAVLGPMLPRRERRTAPCDAFASVITGEGRLRAARRRSSAAE
ncbi:MAG: hypothetical protein ACK56I_22290, partial [bacterium]